MKDVFLCHASEDKTGVVLPIFEALKASSISCWLDQAEINWGDSLIEKINEGLANSRYVIVVLSERFLSKRWPQRELNAVLNIEASTGDTKVLPLVVGSIDLQEIFPLLNDKLYLTWSGDPSEIVKAIEPKLRASKNDSATTEPPQESRSIPLPTINRKISQRDKDLFLKKSFSEMLGYFQEALSKLESHHEGIETDLDEIHKFKFICKVYLDGDLGSECKIWLGGPVSNGISFMQGRNIDINNDNSFGDWLSVEEDGAQIFLAPSGMSIMGGRQEMKFKNGSEGAEYFWRRLIAHIEQT